MKTRLWLISCFVLAALAAACGDNGSGGGDGGNGDGGGDGDGGTDLDAGCTGLCTDAPPFGGGCTVGSTIQCADCIDNDNDGKIDGADIECSGALDDDEGSFSTGIPGDNIDAVMQDCFFDGNSGAGDDGCNIHVCCLLGAADKASCPIGANKYNVAECPAPLGTGTLSPKCIATCGKLAPPGCDCFGCCTICDPANPATCFDILTNPTASPNCNETNLADPTACRRCTKNTMCGNDECGGDTCILCPGQDISQLPPSCSGSASCPIGTTACVGGVNGTCGPSTYCSNGCCIGVIQ